MKQYKAELILVTEVDNYYEGCDPSTTADHGVVFGFKSSDIDLIKQRVSNQTNFNFNEAEPVDGETCLEFCLLETEDGEIPNEHQVNLWKQNKITLLNATYHLFVCSIETTELDAQAIFKLKK